MSDPLERICNLSEISDIDRRRLRAELDFVGDLFARIDRGAGFCEDRGFGWTAAMERAEGSDRLFTSLRAWPILRRLLPRLRHYRHERDPVFGVHSVPSDDLVVARLLVDGRWSFEGRYGVGRGERAVEIRLEAEAIRVSERTIAGGIGDEPFDGSEASADYDEQLSGSLWTELNRKLGPGAVEQAAALAKRMRCAVVPCDLCGRPSHSFVITASVLTHAGPERAPETADLRRDHLAVLRRAMAAQDMPAIRALNPAWSKGYRAERDASYCTLHVGELDVR